MSKVNVVFGDNADSVQDWAMTTSTSIGISRQAALEAAGTYGNLFTALGLTKQEAAGMSTELVGLAADLASFNNEDPSAVLNALRSGLSGEIEPLKRFGIAMNETVMKAKAMELGLGDSVKALTEAEKIQVRYAIIMDQTSNAQGDFARTSDELANSTRVLNANVEDLKAAFGESFTPAATEATNALSDFVATLTVGISKNNDIVEALRETNPALLRQYAITHNLTDEMKALIAEYETAGDATGDLSEEQQQLADTAIDAADAEKQAADAAKELTKYYQGLLGDMQSIHDERERSIEQATRLKEQEQSIKDEIVREQLEYGKLREERELTQDQIDDHVVQMDELNKRLEENSDAQMKLTEDTKNAVQQRIADTVLERLSRDELTSAEYEFFQNYLVQQGLIAQADADRAIAISAAADSVVSDFERQNSVMDTTQQKIDALVNGSPYNIDVNINTHGEVPTIGGVSGGRNYRPKSLFTSPGYLGGFQEGGEFITPGTGRGDRPYLINLEPGEPVSVGRRGGSRGDVIINITGILDRNMVNRITQEVTRAQVN